MNVCVAQIDFLSQDLKAHVRKIKEIIQKFRTADLVVFPELSLHGHPSFERPEGYLYRRMKTQYRNISRDIYGFIKEVDARVIIGELRQRGERFYNLATYVDRDQIDSYVKTHVHWTENFVPGKEMKVFDTPSGKVGVSICFDAAFPEMMRVLALRGAEVLVNIAAVPAAFPVKYVWRRLQAAALNNQVFVLYCNRVGRAFSGHSAIFDPKGEVLFQAGKSEKILRGNLDLRALEEWREEEQIYSHMRPLLYRQICRLPQPKAEEEIYKETEALRRQLSSESVDRQP